MSLPSDTGIELARVLPAGFGVHASRGKWVSAKHLTFISMVVARAHRRDPGFTRIILLTPPRHGKSSLISQYTPAWWLGNSPDERVLLTSYSDRFAALWGRRARDVFWEHAPKVFGLSARASHAATDDWGISGHTGTMATAGTGGTITGRGADLLIVDDPVKDAKEAESETQRERIWDWWQSTAASRLEPNGVAIVVMTHWHQDDLAGRLVKEMANGGEQWTVIRMPAIATKDEVWSDGSWKWERKAGEALWSKRFDVEKLEAIRRRSGSKWWNALYQQQPSPPSGTVAQREWFPIVGALPQHGLVRCRFWDCASTEKKAGSAQDPDWTVGALVAWMPSKKVGFIEHIIRFRGTPGRVNDVILQTAKMDGPSVRIREEEEGGSSGKAVTTARKKALAGYRYKGIKASGSKASNWEPFLIQAEGGNIAMLQGDWNRAFLDEAMSVPQGHDDQMDAVAGGFNALMLGDTGAAPGVW